MNTPAFNSFQVFLLHGRASSPNSPKMKALHKVCEDCGIKAQIPDFSSIDDPEKRIEILKGLLPSSSSSLILLGSSLGGYVATRASQTHAVKGLFLIAPAFYLKQFPSDDVAPRAGKITIVHGWNDEVVPVENSLRFARQYQAELHLLPGDHMLGDYIPQIARLFRLFVQDTAGTPARDNQSEQTSI